MRCTPARRATSLRWVAAGPTVRCNSTVASVIRRRVSASRSARCFSSYFRFSLISLDTMIVELDAEDGRPQDSMDDTSIERSSAMPAAVARLLGPDQGEVVHLLALGVRFMIAGEATGGAFSLGEHPLLPRALGAPLHTHHNEDEYSYVLEGRFGIQLGNQVLEAGPGDLLFKPRGVAHAFWNAGDEPARLLELISPAGFEQYFREL